MSTSDNPPAEGGSGPRGPAEDGDRERVEAGAQDYARVNGSETYQRMRQYPPGQLMQTPGQYFSELKKTDVDDTTITLMQNLFSRDLILGNLDQKDTHEMKLLARNIVEFIEVEHPHQRSTFTASRRKMLSGDYDNGLKPLSGLQKAWIEMAVFNFIARISRSRDGYQQEMNAKQIQVQEMRRQATDTSGWRDMIPGL